MKKLLVAALCFFLLSSHTFSQKRMTYDPSAVNNWKAKQNMTGSEFQKSFDSYKEKGFYLSYIDGYLYDGKLRYAAIWEKYKSPPKMRVRHGMSSSEYQKQYDKQKKDGYKVVHIDGYAKDGKAYYAAIWHKNGTKVRASHGLTSDKYQSKALKNRDDGYRLKKVSAFSIKGKPYYSAIWIKGKGPKQRANHGLTREQFQTKNSKNVGDDYKLVHLDSYKAGGTAKYVAIWEKVGGRYVVRSQMSPKNMQLYKENYYFQGYKPVSISGHDNANNEGYAAVWKQVGGWKTADLRQMDKKFKDVMDKYKIPGGAFAIVKDEKLVYAKGFGYGNKENKEIASATSLWRIASISKPITGVAMMKLIEDTNVSLGSEVFGSGRLLGKTYGKKKYGKREKDIKVRHLLEHRAGGNSWDNNLDEDPDESGVDDKWNDPMFNQNTNGKSHAQTISWLLDVRNPSEEVNTVTAYSNVGYCILGRIIEKKSGMDYHEYVKKNVLKPCGITSMDIGSGYKNKRKYREVVYYGDRAYKMEPWRMDSHGGWIASVVDLMRFSVKVDGASGRKDILKKSSIRTMQSSSYNGKYGKGWDVRGDRTLMEHGGSLPGTSAFLKLMNDGYYYVYMVNARPSDKDDEREFVKEMKAAIENGIDAVGFWPGIDLF